MSQSLGELFVSLKAETGGFVSALSKAAYSAQQASKEISRSFSELQGIASQTFGAFGDFNPAISKLSFVLESAGGGAARMMKELRGVGGALGPIAALGAGAAAGLTTIGIAAIGLAAHTAESAAKMHELAQSTGVPIGTLSGLSFAAKAAGVDIETLATGLERMSKSVFAAATAPAGATNAYTRLGVSIRDAGGNIRPTQDIFVDLADQFSKMPDGIEKTAAAMQIFGRGGAALIPVLNEGKNTIADFLDYAGRTGAILTGPAGEAAREFEMSLAKVSIAGVGAENALMNKLLPSLNYVAEMLAKSAGNGKSWAETTAGSLANLAKFIVSTGDVIFHLLDQIGIFFEFVGHVILGTLETVGRVVFALKDVFTFDFSDARKELSAGLDSFTSAFTDFWGETKKTWSDGADFIGGIWGKMKPGELKPGDATSWMLHNMQGKGAAVPGAPGASGRPDVVAEMVAKLQAEAAAELELAAATEKSIAASTLAKAAAEAETKIAETRTRLLEEEKNLRAQLADARRDEAAGVGSASTTGVGGPGVRAEKLKGEIAGVQAMLAELTKDTPQIKSLYAEIASGDFFAKTGTELNDFIVKTREEGDAAAAMAKAYAQGGDAVQKAFDAAKLAPFEEKLRTINELIAAEKSQGIPTGTVGSASLIGKFFPNQEDARDRIAAQLSEATQAVSDTEAKKSTEQTGKQTNALVLEAQAYNLVAAAALKSGAAQREAAAQAAVLRYQGQHQEATPGEKDLIYRSKVQELDEQHKDSIAEEARAQYDLNASYAQELEKLQEIRKYLVSKGQSTVGVDLKINESGIAHQLDAQKQIFDSQNMLLLNQEKLYDSSIQLTEQWDKAALSVGTIGEKFRAMANEIEIEGQNLGEKFIGTLKKGVDDVSSSLAKFIVTGKAGFTELLNSMAESLLKAQIQWSFSKLLGAFGPKTGGGPGGQQSGPGGTPGIVPGPLGIGGAIAGAFGIKLPGAPGGPGAHGPSGTAGDPVYVTMARGVPLTAAPSGSAGGVGGLFGLGGGSSTPADGSSGSPFYVIPTDSTGSPFGTGNALPITPDDSSGSGGGGLYGSWDSGEGDTGAGGGGAGGLGGFMSQISGVFSQIFSSITSVLGSIVSSIGSLASSVGGGIAGIFGLARGGPVRKGQPYIVGEERPEIFVPDEPGHILPSLASFSGLARRASGGYVSQGISYLVGENRPEVFVPHSASSSSARSSASGWQGDVHMHFHQPTDADSFQRSKGQIYADLQNEWAIAHYRNRG